MSRLHALFQRLRRDDTGAAAVEFALLGGLMISILLAVFQIGMTMQRYNALRSISDEVARYVAVQYQSGNELNPAQIRNYSRSIAMASPYYVEPEGLLISVTPAGTTRIPGTSEFDFTIRGQVSMITGILGFSGFYITYSRAIFVVDE